MKKLVILWSSAISMTMLSFSPSFAANQGMIENSTSSSNHPAVTAEQDLAKVKAHILGYADKLGVPNRVKDVGAGTLCGCLRTSFSDAERYLLSNLGGQILARILAIAIDDFSDGKLDGVVNGKKVSYAQEVASLLGVSVSEEELKAQPLQEPLALRLTGFAVELGTLIANHSVNQEQLVSSLGVFAEKKMFRARKYLAAALIREADRIVALELGNGRFDGLDGEGRVIDWKEEMKRSVESALSQVLDGVM